MIRAGKVGSIVIALALLSALPAYSQWNGHDGWVEETNGKTLATIRAIRTSIQRRFIAATMAWCTSTRATA